MIWGALWRSSNHLDGETRYIMYSDGFPKMFHTRAKVREWIEENYGYIRLRSDLQEEPHGWQMLVPIKLSVKEAGL